MLARLLIVGGILAVMTTITPTAIAADPVSPPGVLYEMRIYTTPEGKLEALNARFRDHTTKLFVKHGMKLIGFWTSQDPKEANKLFYIVAHKNKAAADASWKAFRTDADWVKAKAESEKDGSLTTKIEVIWLNGTDYSPVK